MININRTNKLQIRKNLKALIYFIYDIYDITQKTKFTSLCYLCNKKFKNSILLIINKVNLN